MKKFTSFLTFATFCATASAMPLQIGAHDNSMPAKTVSIIIENYYKKPLEHIHVDQNSRNYTIKSTTLPTRASRNTPWHGEFNITPGVDSSIEIVGNNHFMIYAATTSDDTSGFCMFQEVNQKPSPWTVLKCSVDKIGGQIIVTAEIDHR